MPRRRAVMNSISGAAGALVVLTFGACGSGIKPTSSTIVAGQGPASSLVPNGGAVAGVVGSSGVEPSKGGLAGGAAGVGGNGGGGASGGITDTFRSGRCGDGIIDLTAGEQCDDGNREDNDGCNRACQVEAGWPCTDRMPVCKTLHLCGNGVLTSDEVCDDGNLNDGDGCSKDCQKIEEGFECRVLGKRCTPKCGDGRLIGSETCDDGNSNGGDGCSATCQIEPGADCRDVGRLCRITVCGNGVTEKGEECDCGDGSLPVPAGCPGANGLSVGDGRGCSRTCTKEPKCIGEDGGTRACEAVCGDGSHDSNEECDDGNRFDGDGCSKDCKREKGFLCVDGLVPDAWPCKDSTKGEGCLRQPITTVPRSECVPRCGDGIVAASEECDCGDGSGPLPAGCVSENNDFTYAGCMTNCTFGPFCGDGIVSGPEACDRGRDNGSQGPGGCTYACTTPHFCGDGILDTDRGEDCDLGDLNGQKLDETGRRSDAPSARVLCTKDCHFILL